MYLGVATIDWVWLGTSSAHSCGGLTLETTHEFLHHTSELVLRVRARSVAMLCAEAGRALGALFREEVDSAERGDRREFDLRALDGEALLVDWLNELIYVAETDRWIPTTCEARGESERHVRFRCEGARIAAPPTRVKAATHHGLRIEPVPGGFQAEVILDV